MINLQKIYIDLKKIVYLTLCLKHPTKICLKKVEQAQELSYVRDILLSDIVTVHFHLDL